MTQAIPGSDAAATHLHTEEPAFFRKSAYLASYAYRRHLYVYKTVALPATMRIMRASDVAYESLRDDIIQWRLEPGAPLAEVELSARIGLSRTPVREALSRLIAEGLVSNAYGRTAVVTPVSREHIRKLFELREALDTQAARLAARRRDAAVFEALKREFLDVSSGSAQGDTGPDSTVALVLFPRGSARRSDRRRDG